MGTTSFKLSQLSMTMIEGVVSAWHKKAGDRVEEGEVLLEVETDKMVKEMTAPVSGFLVKITAQEGDVVPVDGELCVISDDPAWTDEGAAQPTQAAQPAPEHGAGPAPAEVRPGGRVRISPLAKRIAQLEDIPYEAIPGTGPGGAIVKKDILAYQESRKAAPPARPAVEHTPDLLFPFQGIRRRTAENMMLSRQNTAMLTTCAEVNMSRVAEARKFVKVSYTTFTVKAAARALEEERFQMLRAQLLDDGIHVKQDININVSVATGRSLVTPVIRHADRKNILTVGAELRELADAGRENRLSPEDLQGGCFTVTNSGVFGSLFYTPIINYPQSAIIGMGKTLETPVVVDGEIVVAPMMYLCLSYDHRLIDGEVGAPFLQKIKYYLEHPEEIIQ